MLDLALGRARRRARVADPRRLRRDGRSRSARCPGPAACRSSRRSTPTRGNRGMQRALFDLKADAGREAFLRLADARRRDHRVVPPRRRRPARHRLRRRVGAQPAHRLLLDRRATARPGPRSAWAGHDVNYLARRRLPRLHRPTRRRPPGAARARRWPTSRPAACRRRWRSWPRSLRRERTGEGEHLDVSIADGAFALMSLYVDEYLATGVEPGPGPLHPHRPLRLLRRLRVRATAGTSSVGAIEPQFWRNLCRLLGLERYADAPDRRRRCRTRSAPRWPRCSPPGPATSGSPCSARPTPAWPPVQHGGRGGRRRAVRRARRLRRRGARRPKGRSASRRRSGPARWRPTGPYEIRDGARHRHRRAAARPPAVDADARSRR